MHATHCLMVIHPCAKYAKLWAGHRRTYRRKDGQTTKALKGHGDLKKKEAISKSLYRIVQSVLTD